MPGKWGRGRLFGKRDEARPEAYTPPPSGHVLTRETQQAATQASATIRHERAVLKRKLKAGTVSLDYVLDHRYNNPLVERMRVYELLVSLPHVGPAKARSAMTELRIAANRRVGGLGPRQVMSLRRRFGSPGLRKWSA